MPLVAVLILVLVEHTATKAKKKSKTEVASTVLILVLVEHTATGNDHWPKPRLNCLNPCFSGTYCDKNHKTWRTLSLCLNPCFSGTYCDNVGSIPDVLNNNVLILVLVEHTATSGMLACSSLVCVLILVLVEHTATVQKATHGEYYSS